MLFFGKLQEYVSRILTNNCVADRFKNEFVIPCEVKDGATGTRVAQLPKALVAERYLIMRKTSVLTFLEMSNSVGTNHEFSRRNPKEVSKVPESQVCRNRRKGYLNATGAYVLKVKSGKLCAGVWRDG